MERELLYSFTVPVNLSNDEKYLRNLMNRTACELGKKLIEEQVFTERKRYCYQLMPTLEKAFFDHKRSDSEFLKLLYTEHFISMRYTNKDIFKPIVRAIIPFDQLEESVDELREYSKKLEETTKTLWSEVNHLNTRILGHKNYSEIKKKEIRELEAKLFNEQEHYKTLKENYDLAFEFMEHMGINDAFNKFIEWVPTREEESVAT